MLLTFSLVYRILAWRVVLLLCLSFSSHSSLISEDLSNCSPLLLPKQLCSTSCSTSAVFPVPGDPEIRIPGLEPLITDSNSCNSHCRPAKSGSSSSNGTSKNNGFRVNCAAWCWIKRTGILTHTDYFITLLAVFKYLRIRKNDIIRPTFV